jgi:cysteinyl-tRNA synthetase
LSISSCECVFTLQKTENLKSGARIKVKDKKKNKEDFVLWKFSKPNEPSWKSPWGQGRPGWHIECSAMSHAILGLPLDIHGGGQDLIFPHHEDEIAQSEAAYETEFAKFWVHNGMVNVEKVKMSKSLGNFKTIKELLKEYDGKVIRYFVISGHYRKPIDFSKKALDSAKNAYQRLKNLTTEIKEDGKINEEYLQQFQEAMDDDLNTPEAIAVLWKMARDEKAEGKYRTIKKMDEVFGLDLLKKEKITIPKEIQALAEKREKARKNKEWEKADKLRDEIKKKGYLIEDSKDGIKIKKA